MKKLLTALLSFAAIHDCLAEDAVAQSVRIQLVSPTDFQVAQRSSRERGELVLAGSVSSMSKGARLPDKLQASVTGKSAFGKLTGLWRAIPWDPRVAAFRGKLDLPAGGWYRLEIRAFKGQEELASAVVEHVGIGEIFVIAGQSNSANHGEERQNTVSGLVVAFDGTAWRQANDPQPIASGSKGSFIPPFGDEIAEHFRVPIGILACGVGATSVREWLPIGTRLIRLPTLTGNVVTVGKGQWEASGEIYESFTGKLKLLGTNGFRAVLWHQGESDANQADVERTLSGDLYKKYLIQLVLSSRQAVGWNAPWFVAQASYHSPADPGSPDIRAAQKSVCDDGVALPGPDTDTLTGDMREKEGSGVHMSAKGLKAHAHLWFEKISPWLDRQLVESQAKKGK
jgi:hypothetical protein